ncbi:MAG: glycoside hydrolase family 3 protein [Salinivirgaceae bacterium]|nr:glycoside hydrolase family 3 protein [Salinivirgaceae bacterium]
MKHFFLFLSFSVLFASCRMAESGVPTLEQKAAQMLMVGFRDTAITAESDVTQWLRDYQIGGVILFEYDSPSKSRPRNITSATQLKSLTDSLKHFSPKPLFIAVDEEGGNVSRLKVRYGFEPTVTPQYLGTLDNEDSTRFYARRIAQACRDMGFNVNFAPAVDVNVNPDCPVIGKIGRSFSADAEVVARNARWFVDEHNKLGILCSLKHFPGHGSSVSDTHLGLADVTETWTNAELLPYWLLLRDSLPVAVMTSHIFNRTIDSLYPATLSAATLSMLRNSLQFNGLVFSDDMMMNAVSKFYGLEDAICLAINAGVDVLIFSNNIDTYNPDIVKDAVNIIVRLVGDGKISKDRIDQSYQRIMEAKKKLVR